MLASVLSSAAGICSHNNVSSTTIEPQELLPPAASEISMLAALPFASIAMPMTNIAPQKTLSVAHADVSGMEALDATESRVSQPVVSALPLPPTKRQRRSDPPLNNINSIVSQQKALGCQFANVAGGRAGPVASGGNASGSSSQNSSRSNADASATASKKSNTAAVAATPENRAPTSVSPPRSTASVSSLGKGSRHNMVPLAPRLPVQSPSESTDASKKQQQKKQSAKDGAAQNKSTGDKKSVLASVSSSDSSRSGSSTPPGLSVLAKIAQKQVPIRVKEEEAMAVNSIDKKQQQNVYQGRLIAPSPANRQTRSPSLPPSQTEESQTSPSNAPDSAAQKRQERLIKNRAAALLSRKRKRDYMTKLESEVEDLRSFNNSLVKRLEDMERAMKALAEERDLLRSESATSRGLMSATSSSSTGAATSNTSDSASDSNNKNKDSSASEESTKEQKESSESNEGKGNGVEASDCAMDTDDDMSEEIQQQHTTAGAGTSSKQRTAGTLLMAMLFSFSLFTLPSLYTSSSQITAGGPQSAGIVPIHSLPSTEPRLLIGSGKRIDNVADPPLIERVRRSISALTQQAGSASPQQVSGGDAAQYANGSDSSTNWMRPMSMEESAVLHAWIRHGLSSGGNGAGNSAASAASEYDAVVSGKDGAPSMQKELERKIRAESEPTSLSVVRQQPRQTNNGHAMLYCPAMQHVVFSGDSVEAGSMSGLVSGGGNDGFVYRPSEPRVIGTTKQQASGGKTKASSDVAVVRGGMDDVDSKIVVASPRVGSVADWHSASHDLPPPHAAAATTAEAAADLVPTHAGGIVIPPASTNRPKLSLYSPVVSGGGKGADGGILPPWDEHARLLAASDSEGNDGAAAPLAEAAESSRQRYLRIDVEVVGSRWVTADKFAHGLY
ncbi:hypothetical protein H4217_001236 [Coemansia sp. RSA 1939]|nr:hypothetical protein H4217_001236 [Coemansia sp. RSA 1939]KAJ2616587.1 hypothetical protein EV177_001004 [Coemansia sp. RSA 1804]KAJ2695017.1 hypothetical protein GGH99_000366 [Coemansia sp. RSA 1285]